MVKSMKKVLRKTMSVTLSLALALTMIMPIGVSAQTTAPVTYDAEHATITVTITTDKLNRAAVISVYDASYNDGEGKYWVLAEAERTSKDLFVYSTVLPSDMPSGTYTVVTKIGGEEATDTFSHINSTTAGDAMVLINAATKATFPGVLRQENVYRSLAVDIDRFNAKADLITDLFFLYRPVDKDGYKDLTPANFASLYAKCLALAELKGASDDTIKAYLSNYSATIEFSEEYADFAALDETDPVKAAIKQEIIDRFKAGVYTEKTSDTQYTHWFALANINVLTDNTKAVYKNAILNTYSELLLLDLTEYNTKDSDSVIEAVMFDKNANVAKKYDSIAALKEAFYRAVDEAPEKSTSSGGGAGTSGGQGGGGFTLGTTGDDTAKDKNVFTDVTANHWCAEPIEKLYKKSIISGDGNGTFRPDDSVSRAEFAKMLVNALFVEYQANAAAAFNDVAGSAWYASYVNAAAELGIVNGDENGNFNPNATITRQDMAVMIKRAAEKAGVSLGGATKTFVDDASISAYAKDAVSALGGAGILNGMEDGSFAPKGALSRAQAVKALYEVMKRAGKF
jgi:hypothetical protein